MLQILLLSALLILSEEGHQSNPLLQKKQYGEDRFHPGLRWPRDPLPQDRPGSLLPRLQGHGGQPAHRGHSEPELQNVIWQIGRYISLRKILGGWGKSVGEHAVVLDKVAICVNYDIL